MISNFTAARRAIYSQRSASRSDTRAWRGADVGFPLPSCFPIGRMRCEPSAAGLGTSQWMCVLGAQRPLAAVAHVASEWPPDGRPRRRDGSFCGAGMPRAYVGRGWCSGRDRTVAYTSYNAHLRGCPRLPGARVFIFPKSAEPSAASRRGGEVDSGRQLNSTARVRSPPPCRVILFDNRPRQPRPRHPR